MRKLLLFVCLAFMSLITDAQVVKSVNVEEAGTLQALLGNDYLNITDLTVTGNLNGNDIITLRAMCGVNTGEEQTGTGKLEKLDMSGAVIKAGGEMYATKFSNKSTTDNEIGVAMFRYCNTLKEVRLPNSVVTIKNNSFEKAVGLKTVIIGANTKEIQKAAFRGCTALENVDMPATLTTLGNETFKDCVSLTNVKLPDALTQVPELCFSNTNIQDLVIPDNVTYIGWYAFQDLQNLVTITFGKSMNTLSKTSFQRSGAYVEDVYINYPGTEDQKIIGGDYVMLFDGFYDDDGDGITQDVRYTDEELAQIKVHVPANRLEDYKASPKWNKFTLVANTASNVEPVKMANAKVVARYTLDGKALSKAQKGLNLVKMSDGTVRKELVR